MTLVRDENARDEHRLVHRIVEDEVRIAACRYHCGS